MGKARFEKSGDCVIDTKTKIVYVKQASLDSLLEQREKCILVELNSLLRGELKTTFYASSDDFVVDKGYISKR